jgi:hypothetical protein
MSPVSTTTRCFAAVHESVSGTFRTSQPDSGMSAVGGRAEVVIASPDFRVRPNPDLALIGSRSGKRPCWTIAIPRSASAGASSRNATRFKAPRGSLASSARAAAVISDSL